MRNSITIFFYSLLFLIFPLFIFSYKLLKLMTIASQWNICIITNSQIIINYKRMPKIRTLKTKKVPEGFEQIEPVLEEFQKQMKDAENAPMDAQTKQENYWKIMRLHHQRTRYIYEIYYDKGEISKELYQFLVREHYANGSLIAKWKKKGYEKLCCLQCIYSHDTNYKNTCICRVPRVDLEEGKLVMCQKCGCRGCASSD